MKTFLSTYNQQSCAKNYRLSPCVITVNVDSVLWYKILNISSLPGLPSASLSKLSSYKKYFITFLWIRIRYNSSAPNLVCFFTLDYQKRVWFKNLAKSKTPEFSVFKSLLFIIWNWFNYYYSWIPDHICSFRMVAFFPKWIIGDDLLCYICTSLLVIDALKNFHLKASLFTLSFIFASF